MLSRLAAWWLKRQPEQSQDGPERWRLWSSFLARREEKVIVGTATRSALSSSPPPPPPQNTVMNLSDHCEWTNCAERFEAQAAEDIEGFVENLGERLDDESFKLSAREQDYTLRISKPIQWEAFRGLGAPHRPANAFFFALGVYHLSKSLQAFVKAAKKNLVDPLLDKYSYVSILNQKKKRIPKLSPANVNVKRLANSNACRFGAGELGKEGKGASNGKGKGHTGGGKRSELFDELMAPREDGQEPALSPEHPERS
ncbi:hypothetical protein BKA70DRAFT_1435589 [Coprinopsis sp. MPI-PUGE-AT-0042]|nr:hypothetical protein BKA70DRAFT_1435589 [Coprinopsis sp. MPI-PUGE-AT-0042]